MAVTQSTRILRLLREHSGDEHYHPLCALYDLTKELDATVSDKITIHKTIAKYTEAELKAVEYINSDNAPVGLNINITRQPVYPSATDRVAT